MRNKFYIIFSLVILIGVGLWMFNSRQKEKISLIPKENKGLQDGDILFQTSLSSQSKAIQLATHSPYSHMGILLSEGGEWWVLEAIQPVKKTPLNDWINRGKDGIYVVKRLKHADSLLNSENIKALKKSGYRHLTKKYDLIFAWSDDEMYCSELIWKMYHEALGIELCKLQQLQVFDFSNAVVKKKMFERYGNNLPLKEWVVSPQAIFESNLLESVDLP
jgi:hypothetical protein